MRADRSVSSLPDAQAVIQSLQAELAQTNREVIALGQRLDERAAELRATQDELHKTNTELLQLTLELEDRVAERTAELASVNLSLREEIIRRHAAEVEIRALNASLEQRVRERTAELAALNQELESFAHSVSHDLRAPLRGIDGWSQALLEDYGDVLDAQGRAHLTTVRAETCRMAELIDALLALSRASRGELRRETVDLSALARELERELRRDHPAREVELVLAPEMVVQGDPVLLRAALRNLLGNAWKFTARCARPRIECGVRREGSQPVYFIRDNGTGFDMRYAAKLFSPFQRLHHQAEYPGTGIGLATVQRILHRHGGRIWAEGVVGEGAVFSFTV